MAEGARLLSGYGGETPIEGSNPSLSASAGPPPPGARGAGGGVLTGYFFLTMIVPRMSSWSVQTILYVPGTVRVRENE